MKVVRGRADARWLPSRYNFALFRLYALLRTRMARPEPAEVVIAIDRHQSSAENFTVGAWTILTTAAFVAAALSRWWSLPAALLAAIPVAMALHQVSIIIVGVLLIRRGNNLRVNSIVLMVWMTAAALYFARSSAWVRFAAWQFLAIVALNAVAAVVVLLLRNTITDLERSMGGYSSEF